MSFDHHFYCFYYCSKLRKFVNLYVLTNLAITVGIVNQTTTETLFTIVKDNCLSWCDGALRFCKDNLCLVSFDMDGHLRIRLTVAVILLIGILA